MGPVIVQMQLQLLCTGVVPHALWPLVVVLNITADTHCHLPCLWLMQTSWLPGCIRTNGVEASMLYCRLVESQAGLAGCLFSLLHESLSLGSYNVILA